MLNSTFISEETIQENIRLRWDFKPTKQHQDLHRLESFEEVVAHLKEMKFALHRSLNLAQTKCALLRKKMRNIAAHTLIARLMPSRKQASRSHHCSGKSAKKTSSTSAGDGSSNPDDTQKNTNPHYIQTTLLLLTLVIALFVHISNTEVAK